MLVQLPRMDKSLESIIHMFLERKKEGGFTDVRIFLMDKACNDAKLTLIWEQTEDYANRAIKHTHIYIYIIF